MQKRIGVGAGGESEKIMAGSDDAVHMCIIMIMMGVR